ncbi:inositol monophosphatase family protein [Saccharothrix isguenensis]
MRPLDQLADIAQKAVAIGNSLIKNTRPQTVTEKSDRDTYTDVDVRIERRVRAYLVEATPEIAFIGEEEGDQSRVVSREFAWVLDPIDGTSNFVHGVPLCGVSLALMKDNQTVAAAVALPYFDLIYSAAKGCGAFANGTRIEVSNTASLSKSIVALGDYAIGNRAVERNGIRVAVTASLANIVERIRMFGSAAHDLVWLAEGRIDAAVMLSNNTLDVAAGVLIAKEAGAEVCDIYGDPHDASSNSTVVTTKALKDELLQVIQSAL